MTHIPRFNRFQFRLILAPKLLSINILCLHPLHRPAPRPNILRIYRKSMSLDRSISQVLIQFLSIFHDAIIGLFGLHPHLFQLEFLLNLSSLNLLHLGSQPLGRNRAHGDVGLGGLTSLGLDYFVGVLVAHFWDFYEGGGQGLERALGDYFYLVLVAVAVI